jgi:alpha-tubulin suppressor-like RCC1 family protein
MSTSVSAWGVRTLAAGGGHSAAVLTDGSMLTWGDNDRGQLGDGTTTHRYRPVQVTDRPVLGQQ